jgi:branched-chain amino acid transport system permease protein
MVRLNSSHVSAISLFLVMALAVPFIPSDYIFDAILTPFVAISLAALGLNLLAGYAGQVSLGSAAFMAVGAFTAYNFLLRIPGLPSLRLKGFYLAISTLAAQFFVQWALTNFAWFSGGDTSGVITTPPLFIGPIAIDTSEKRYLLSLFIVAALTLIAARLVAGRNGRELIAIRDNELAARVLGVKILHTKLFACALSSFYIGVAGALWAFLYLQTVEPAGFDLDRSFEILFVVIIGGLASIRGAFLGAAFIVVLPLLDQAAAQAVRDARFPPQPPDFAGRADQVQVDVIFRAAPAEVDGD